ncbi:MBL fold metallo-hydrolase [Massilia sp. KIM]|nr:MBL fold metallo-hydrolase [Massilia sp. KIM]
MLANCLPASAQQDAGIGLVVLGSGGPGAVGRAGSSFLVLLDGVPRILVDAGGGAFTRLGETGLSLAKLDTILLTHLHADHAGGLPALLKARVVGGGGPAALTVVGPGGGPGFPSTTRLIALLFGKGGAFAYLPDFAAPLRFHVRDVASSASERVLVARDGLRILASAGHHGEAPAIIYRIEYQGRSICFSGDIDNKGHAALRRLARGVDLLVFNSVVLDPPGSPAQLYELHTPPRAIGELARDARVSALLLTHLNPGIDNAKEAVLASIRAAYDGPVAFARDGSRWPNEAGSPGLRLD